MNGNEMLPKSPPDDGGRDSRRGPIRFEGYDVDRARWQLSWRGEPISLARKPFDVLVYLLTNRDRVVTKDELLEKLWPDQFVDENNLAQQVSFLRKALSKHESGRKIIETVPGRGYRFVADVESPVTPVDEHDLVVTAEASITRVVVEEELDASERPAPALPSPSKHVGRIRIYCVAAALPIVATLVIWFGWRWWQTRQGGDPVRVVLMTLDGTTSDKILDRALNDAVRFDLTQSPFVSVVPAAQVGATLQRMRRKPDETLTQDSAREVCERTNSQAVVRAELAHEGPRFLLTGEAVGCVNGATLATATQEAKRTEDLLVAINKLVGSLRQQLGESRRSVARFTTPTSVLETASLDAYRAVSQAGVFNHQGKYAEAIAMDKQALSFDPNFAGAYLDLASNYMTLDDHGNATAAASKAYELRNTVSPFVRQAISVRYDELVTGDLYAAEKDAELWTQLYPNFPIAWNYLSVDRAHLGDHAGAIDPALKVVTLRPDLVDFYAPVCQEQMHAGDFEAAKRSCGHELAADPDQEFPHMTLAQLAFSENDAAAFQQQLEWLTKHPKNPIMLAAEAEMSIAKGRFAEAKQFITQASEVYREQGSPASAVEMNNMIAFEFLAAGDKPDGTALLKTDQIDQDSEQYGLIALVFTGRADRAEALLKDELGKHPQDTLWNFARAPEVRGWEALVSKRPEDGLKALGQPGVLDARDGIVHYLRGQAYLAAQDPAKAEIEFRWVLARPGLDHSFAHSQSWLGLGRALAAEGNKPAASDAYQHFIALWATADTDAPLLHEAKTELAQLNQR